MERGGRKPGCDPVHRSWGEGGEGSRIRKILLTFTEFVVEIHGDGAERSAHLSGFKCKSVAAASGSLKLLLLLLLLFINLFIF